MNEFLLSFGVPADSFQMLRKFHAKLVPWQNCRFKVSVFDSCAEDTTVAYFVSVHLGGEKKVSIRSEVYYRDEKRFGEKRYSKILYYQRKR